MTILDVGESSLDQDQCCFKTYTKLLEVKFDSQARHCLQTYHYVLSWRVLYSSYTSRELWPETNELVAESSYNNANNSK